MTTTANKCRGGTRHSYPLQQVYERLQRERDQDGNQQSYQHQFGDIKNSQHHRHAKMTWATEPAHINAPESRLLFLFNRSLCCFPLPPWFPRRVAPGWEGLRGLSP